MLVQNGVKVKKTKEHVVLYHFQKDASIWLNKNTSNEDIHLFLRLCDCDNDYIFQEIKKLIEME
jgi:phosphoribosyl-AMP cyclohydrolase